MVTYGDGLTNIDVPALVKYHKQQGKLATVTAVRATSRFGVMQMDDHGLISSFQEKPSLEGWINAGFFVFEPGVFDYLESDETVLEEAPLHRLASEGQLAAYQHTGPFLVMDTYREYISLNKIWDAGEAPWKIWK
jgi:glucose-1-phosphate cytidylyltransferase